jgi:hypothetical protein
MGATRGVAPVIQHRSWVSVYQFQPTYASKPQLAWMF